MTKYERETVINFNEEEDKATIYSCSSPLWTKCKKLGLKQIDCTKNEGGRIVSMTFEINKKLVSFRNPIKPRVLSSEQRNVLRERMRAIRENLSIQERSTH